MHPCTGTEVRYSAPLYRHWGKVKCTLVQALRLCTDRTAHRGSRGIALPFHDHGTRRGWGVSVTPRPLFTPGKDPVPARWAPGPVWTGEENLTPIGIRSTDRPTSSLSLYRLRYPAHKHVRHDKNLSNLRLFRSSRTLFIATFFCINNKDHVIFLQKEDDTWLT